MRTEDQLLKSTAPVETDPVKVTNAILEIHRLIRHTHDQVMTRDGSDTLANFMLKRDYFTAPASCHFHCAFYGGLAVHSWGVYQALQDLLSSTKTEMDEESKYLVTIMHDLCKCQYYRNDQWKWFKGEESGAKWEKKFQWTIDDKIPLGHGERSLFILQNFVRVSVEEALSIRHHLGFVDQGAHNRWPSALHLAFQDFPCCVAAHLADFTTALTETEMSFLYDGVWYVVPEELRLGNSQIDLALDRLRQT